MLERSGEMDLVSRQILAGEWDQSEFYKQYLAQSYHYVFHSCRMLAAAMAHTNANQTDFYKRCLQNLKEESGHDKMALSDLKALGGEIAMFPETGATRALWEPQFYKIQKQTTSLLGYILALENIAVSVMPKVYEVVEPIYGKMATKFLRVHVEEDPHHVKEAMKQIDLLDRREQEAVWANFDQSCASYRFFMAEVARVSAQHSKAQNKENPKARRAG